MRKFLLYIRKLCPCNEYPLKPHFYIAKLGFAGVYLFFLFLLQNIGCGYSLEPPHSIYVLSKNKKNIKNFPLKIFNFYNFKNLCILHGQVFIMTCKYMCRRATHWFKIGSLKKTLCGYFVLSLRYVTAIDFNQRKLPFPI